MDFQLSEEQEDLRASVRSVLDQACPPSVVREAFEAADGEYDPRNAALWQQMAKLDWPALAIPESCGGLGLGFVELSLVVEELGQSVAPSPFLATATQYVPMVLEAGAHESLLRPVAESGGTGTLAVAEPGGRWDLESVKATARKVSDGWVLEGRKSWVLDGASADSVAVVARGEEGLGVFVVQGRTAPFVAHRVIDPTQPLAELVLDGIVVPPEGVLSEPGDPASAAAIERALEQAVTAMATSVVGTCRSIFETTLQYAKDRQQYGRPIGSFQALKHRLVDMYCALERASALCNFAALTIAEGDERRSLAASMAKAAAGECQRLMVQEGLQLHGGIGFTWEHDLHMWLKRAKSGDFLFGSALAHRAEVARLLGLAA